jgi:hypothetical protein
METNVTEVRLPKTIARIHEEAFPLESRVTAEGRTPSNLGTKHAALATLSHGNESNPFVK